MKLNKITNIALSGALMLLGAFSLSSCSDKNDWDVDGSFDRLFHTTSLSVSPDENSAEITFDKTPNTTGYQVECSTEELNDDVEFGKTANSITSTVTTSPATIEGLEAETTYYLRLRSTNDEGKVSKWVYLDDKSFTTKAEQIITLVTPKATTALVEFNENKSLNNVSRIAWYHVSDGQKTEEGSVDVNGTELSSNKSYTIEGLKPNYSYTVRVFAGEKKRGEYKFRTTEQLPEGYEQLEWNENTTITDVLSSATQQDVVVLFPQGAKIDEGSITIPSNIKNIYFWGKEGDKQPEWTVKVVKLEGDKGIVKFTNMNLKNKGTDADYIISPDAKAGNISSIQFEKCKISNTRGVVRFDKYTKQTDAISIYNCVINNIGSYGIVNSKITNDNCVKSIKITNATIANVEADGCIVNSQQNGIEMAFTSCTFWNCGQGGKNFINLNSKNPVPVFDSCLLGWDSAIAMKAVSTKKVTCTNTYYTSDCTWSNGKIGEDMKAKGSEVFTNPSKNEFYLNDAYKDKYGTAGDPRWVK